MFRRSLRKSGANSKGEGGLQSYIHLVLENQSQSFALTDTFCHGEDTREGPPTDVHVVSAKCCSGVDQEIVMEQPKLRDNFHSQGDWTESTRKFLNQVVELAQENQVKRATGITHAIHGNFSGTKQQEIVVSRGKILEVLRPDSNTGKVYVLLTEEVFGVIRSLMPFRLTGGTKDYIVIGSDSGRIVILEYVPSKNIFEKVHQETFGKSGCRCIVPGQYLAIDPKGRAIMIGAVEKQKLVYILNRDAQARVTISSPLEAHKSNTLVYHMVGVDVGFENPTFACLEIDYEEVDNDPSGEAAQKAPQMLTFYELDLGLNHVICKYSEQLEEHANFLITVPGGNEGPSGMLICSENCITYKNFGDQPDIRCPIPRRRNDLDDPERVTIFICSATHKTKSFFFLAQTEQGDIFKITLETDKDMVTEIRLKYFDTVPIASAICVLKTGFLFCASEFGNHNLYQIAHLGDDDDEPEFSSAMPLEEGDTFFFAPRPLKNLVMVDEMDSLSPIMNFQIADLANEDSPQLFTLCCRGPRSSLRVLRHGLEVYEMAVSELPGNPNAVWTVKKNIDDEYDAYIIVSFVNATLVLSIGETVEEVKDSGFLGTTPTLSCSQLGDDALVQIYPDGIRHIRSDKCVNEWKTPGKKTIVKCAVNQRQVVIALTGGELVHFELDSNGQLNEYTERKEMSHDVICMALGRVPSGEQRSRFLAVGLADDTVRIISLDPSDCLSPLSLQSLPASPESLCIVEMGGHEAKEDMEGGGGSLGGLFLNIGLQVSEMAISELPGNTNAFLTVKKNSDSLLITLGRDGPSLKRQKVGHNPQRKAKTKSVKSEGDDRNHEGLHNDDDGDDDNVEDKNIYQDPLAKQDRDSYLVNIRNLLRLEPQFLANTYLQAQAHLLYGQPGLADYVRNYFDDNLPREASFFEIYVRKCKESDLKDTLRNAAAIEPSVLLLNNLHQADPLLIETLIKGIKEIMNGKRHVVVLATTVKVTAVDQDLLALFFTKRLKELSWRK